MCIQVYTLLFRRLPSAMLYQLSACQQTRGNFAEKIKPQKTSITYSRNDEMLEDSNATKLEAFFVGRFKLLVWRTTTLNLPKLVLKCFLLFCDQFCDFLNWIFIYRENIYIYKYSLLIFYSVYTLSSLLKTVIHTLTSGYLRLLF